MTHLGGAGRANKLTKQIVASIKKAIGEGIPLSSVENIFGDLLKDHVIRGKLKDWIP
jgi:hypothetical protein